MCPKRSMPSSEDSRTVFRPSLWEAMISTWRPGENPPSVPPFRKGGSFSISPSSSERSVSPPFVNGGWGDFGDSGSSIFTTTPGLSLRPGLARACQAPSAFRRSSRNSTLLPVSARRPYSLAGMTRLWLKTITSPGRRYSKSSGNCRCSRPPDSRCMTISRDASRGSIGVCAMSSGGRS